MSTLAGGSASPAAPTSSSSKQQLSSTRASPDQPSRLQPYHSHRRLTTDNPEFSLSEAISRYIYLHIANQTDASSSHPANRTLAVPPNRTNHHNVRRPSLEVPQAGMAQQRLGAQRRCLRRRRPGMAFLSKPPPIHPSILHPLSSLPSQLPQPTPPPPFPKQRPSLTPSSFSPPHSSPSPSTPCSTPPCGPSPRSTAPTCT